MSEKRSLSKLNPCCRLEWNMTVGGLASRLGNNDPCVILLPSHPSSSIPTSASAEISISAEMTCRLSWDPKSKADYCIVSSRIVGEDQCRAQTKQTAPSKQGMLIMLSMSVTEVKLILTLYSYLQISHAHSPSHRQS